MEPSIRDLDLDQRSCNLTRTARAILSEQSQNPSCNAHATQESFRALEQAICSDIGSGNTIVTYQHHQSTTSSAMIQSWVISMIDYLTCSTQNTLIAGLDLRKASYLSRTLIGQFEYTRF